MLRQKLGSLASFVSRFLLLESQSLQEEAKFTQDHQSHESRSFVFCRDSCMEREAEEMSQETE